MRIVKKEIAYDSRKDRKWDIVPLGDLHLGHINTHKGMILDTIKYIEEHDNIFWIGMGDYCDAIPASDKRYDPSAVDKDLPTPDVQYRYVTKILDPIKDKCLGLLDGNHDRKHWKKHNHNYVDTMAYHLGVPYLELDAYIRLAFKRIKSKTNINIYAHHGWSSSRTAGARVNNIHSLADIFPGLDLYLMGHTHDKGPAPPRQQLFVDNRMNIKHQEMNFVHTGAYLRGYVDGTASYVEEKAYKPAGLGSTCITVEIDPGSNSVYSRPRYAFSSLPY